MTDTTVAPVHQGPCEIPCRERCEVPAGARLAEVPEPRHQWGDVLVCPFGCGRAFLVLEEEGK